MTVPERDDDLCPVCLSHGLRDLCDPWRGQSLVSDMSTVPDRLGRAACVTCGLVRRRWLPTPDEQHAVFNQAYSLFAEAPSAHAQRRQAAIAQWITEALNGFAPTSILEFGCGDGSLLEAFAAAFPAASLRGVEPAPPAVQQARRRGIEVVAGFAEVAAAGVADVCLSVNVIEHVAQPLDFLRAIRDSVTADGWVVVACPDGDVPNYELLFHDHVFSFSRNALEVLCARAGLIVVGGRLAPTAIGPFQLVVARRARDGERPLAAIDRGGLRIAEAIDAYLAVWSELEEVLLARIGDAEQVYMFGSSDITALLRIYAPAVWALTRACVIDGDPATQTFLDRPLGSYASLQAPQTIVLGLRPGSQDAVARRLAADGHRIVQWNDVVSA